MKKMFTEWYAPKIYEFIESGKAPEVDIQVSLNLSILQALCWIIELYSMTNLPPFLGENVILKLHLHLYRFLATTRKNNINRNFTLN